MNRDQPHVPTTYVSNKRRLRNFLLVITILLVPAGGASAHTPWRTMSQSEIPNQCHDRGILALSSSVVGERMLPSQMGSCPSPISSPPPGSGNWSIMLHTGIMHNHDSGLEGVYPWLYGTNGWSLNDKDHSWNWTATLTS